jgi:hypothetical protein
MRSSSFIFVPGALLYYANLFRLPKYRFDPDSDPDSDPDPDFGVDKGLP